MAEPQIFVTKSPPLRPGSPDIEGSAPQIIAQNPTFDSSSADEGDKNRTIRRNSSSESEDDDDGIVEDIEVVERQRNPLSKHEAIDCSLFASWEDIASQVFYISTFAILGTVLRAYMGRFFGLDCLQKEYGTQVDDYVAPVSSLLCITSDGKVQRGGALFIDLPSNILGT